MTPDERRALIARLKAGDAAMLARLGITLHTTRLSRRRMCRATGRPPSSRTVSW